MPSVQASGGARRGEKQEDNTEGMFSFSGIKGEKTSGSGTGTVKEERREEAPQQLQEQNTKQPSPPGCVA